MSKQTLKKTLETFFIDPDYKSPLAELGLTSIDAVFSFDAGTNLAKNNLAPYRTRLRFEIKPAASVYPITAFLKRYDGPPLMTQLKNWLSHRHRRSCAFFDFEAAAELSRAGINTPKTIACGEQWEILFEKRSFIITEKIPNAESLERRLPDCFTGPPTVESLRLRRAFIAQLAAFVRDFHRTRYRHRDLYLSHIFYGDNARFYLIDLARAFRPKLFAERFRRKDISQLYYSAPAGRFSNTDRLRFYFAYTGRCSLTGKDKIFIRKITSKARRMARHDTKHGKSAPFAGRHI
ncbi:MAG TPA: lipopolysaccharide kinase InaA family protein [Sedimentisphaerales bacterium]|nr:lipopolysaccharide kinase InaA family protein [Sedimentisphaerales bacterium]